MDGSILGSLSAVFNEYHLILCAAVWGSIRRCSQESLSHLSLCTSCSEIYMVLHRSTNLRHCPSVSLLTHRGSSFLSLQMARNGRNPGLISEALWTVSENHYCSREEPLRGQLAAESWRVFKENSLHFKTMIFFGGGGGVQWTIWKEGTLPQIAGKQIYWRKPLLLPLLGSKMCILKCAVPKQRCFKWWDCRRKTWQGSVLPQYKVHPLFKFTSSLHGSPNNHPN